MVDSKENYKFDLGVKRLRYRLQNFHFPSCTRGIKKNKEFEHKKHVTVKGNFADTHNAAERYFFKRWIIKA